jgi:hypothetical protein
MLIERIGACRNHFLWISGSIAVDIRRRSRRSARLRSRLGCDAEA